VGRWFVDNDRTETLDFFGDVGASDLVPEVRDGRLHRAETVETSGSGHQQDLKPET
jgi:2-phosphosulfolactate phosphatase